jgi:diguanylate cyclase (GGDEF)-like protein
MTRASSKKEITGELLDAVAAISRKENAQKIAREVARQMVIFIQATGCAISKWDNESGLVVKWAEYEISGRIPPANPYKLSDYPVKKSVLDTSTPAQMRIDDAGINDSVRSWMEKGEIKSLLISPLQARGQNIGIIELYDALQTRQFSQDEIRLVQLLSTHAGIALERAEILEEARQRTAELEAVWHARLSHTTSLELEDVLNAILESALGLFGDARDAHIFLYDQDMLSFGAAMWADGHVGEPIAKPRKSGATYTVARTGEWLVIPDIKKHALFTDAPEDWEGAQISMPLSTSKRLVGVMNIWFQSARTFSDDVLRILKLFGDQAAVAISRAELLAEARQRSAELEAIWQASLVRTTSLELEDVLTAILESTLGVYGDAQNAHIFLYDQDVLSFGAALWPGGRAGDPVAMPRKKGVTYSVAQTGELLVVPDMRTHPLFVDAPKEWKGALIGVPLSVGEQVVGVMNIAYSTPQKFSEDALRVIRLLGDQAAIAISNAKLHEIVSRQAKTDPLTGLANRRTMQERLDLEHLRTQRTGKPFTCILGDLDHFKRINDTYGHDCGDYVIITIADLIQQTIRAVDLVARWGGEEFCILLPEADRSEADTLLRRIYMKLTDNVFTWEQHTFSVKMTFGMTSHNRGDQIKDTLRRADEALYQGKEAGRNQIVFIP